MHIAASAWWSKAAVCSSCHSVGWSGPAKYSGQSFALTVAQMVALVCVQSQSLYWAAGRPLSTGDADAGAGGQCLLPAVLRE